jgi:hypothetical protein
MKEERIQRAERLLAELRAGGCVVTVVNGRLTFQPPPAAKVLLELEDLKEELQHLLLTPKERVTTELGFPVDVREAPPPAWSGGTHDGSRLPPTERKIILDLMAEGCSDSEIRRRTGHGRNTIAAIAASPERAAWLKETRQARMLAAEDSMLRERDALIEKLEISGKLKLSDLNSAAMITGIAIKDSGGSAPMRVEVKHEHGFALAAELMAGGARVSAAASFAPVHEAEVVKVKKSEG